VNLYVAWSFHLEDRRSQYHRRYCLQSIQTLALLDFNLISNIILLKLSEKFKKNSIRCELVENLYLQQNKLWPPFKNDRNWSFSLCQDFVPFSSSCFSSSTILKRKALNQEISPFFSSYLSTVDILNWLTILVQVYQNYIFLDKCRNERFSVWSSLILCF